MMEYDDRFEPAKLAITCLLSCLSFLADYLKESGNEGLNPQDLLAEVLKKYDFEKATNDQA